MANIGARQLTEAIARDGRRKDWVAERLGVDPATLWRYEQGEMRPRPEVRALIAEMFGVPVSAWDEPATTEAA